MNFISHRVNTIEALEATDQAYGVEVDIRSHGSQLVIHHDPFTLSLPLDLIVMVVQ